MIGYPSLASAAYDQGRIAAQALVKGEATAHLIEDIPTGSAPFRKSVLSAKPSSSLRP
ncbi:hypothetical protein ACVXG7_17125 [Enterobacter hormaechei]